MRLLSVVIASLFAGLWCGAATAQTDTQPPIVVEAENVEQRANEFVQQVALAPSDQLYARWDERICPSVAGIAPAEAQTLIDHIAMRANEVGLRPGRQGCQRNVVIIFAPDADVLSREIVSNRRDLMGVGQDDIQTAGSAALEEFASVSRAVRWWHVSYTVTSDGERLMDTGTTAGQGDSIATRNLNAMGEGGSSVPGVDSGIASNTSTASIQGAEGVRSRGSRLGRSTRRDIGFVLVIVDARRIAGLPSEAVADYIAMATLVQLDPNSSLIGHPTILNLFAQTPPQVTAMTDWDRAFVRGLYRGPRDSATARQQRAAISREIADELRE